MWLEGLVFKAADGWVAESEPLDVITQGKSRRDAMAMLKDAIELLAEDSKCRLTVEVRQGAGDAVFLGCPDIKAWFAFLLRRQRQIGQVTAQEAARRLGSRYKNAYAAYEQAKREPSIDMMAKLLTAANPGAQVIMIFGKTPEKRKAAA